jgi:two-component system, LytTR family, sensor kinase
VGWRITLGAYTLLGLIFSSQVWIDYAYAQHPIAWWQAVGVALADWYVWALFTPGVVWLARRFRIGRARWAAPLAMHVPVSLACAVLKQPIDALSAGAITGIVRGPFSFLKVHITLLTYWAIVGVTYAVEQYQESRARELRAAQLQTALARAQVQSLQMQLHPHFLFNTLNAIAALMREDVEAADVMIAGLGDLLRAALATADQPDVPLRRELEFVQMYLDIQLARLGERLTVRISAEPDTLELAVPTLLLQPLVENAIHHGAAIRPGLASVDVHAFRDDAMLIPMLIIEVTDDGPGPPAAMSAGHGLENTRLRLSAAFGPQATLALTRRPTGGATVRVAIPIRA